MALGGVGGQAPKCLYNTWIGVVEIVFKLLSSQPIRDTTGPGKGAGSQNHHSWMAELGKEGGQNTKCEESRKVAHSLLHKKPSGDYKALVEELQKGGHTKVVREGAKGPVVCPICN